MTFEELKFEILDRQRKLEINKLFHLYVKAESYSDILKIIKSEGNFRWILNNGFRDLIQYFPVEELEAENFYQDEVTLTDQTTDIILLSGSHLNLTQNIKNRCRVIIDGASANITANDMSMVEIEVYQRASLIVNNNDWAYIYLKSMNFSSITLNGNDNSTFYFEAYQDSFATANVQPNSYIYRKLFDNAILNINTV